MLKRIIKKFTPKFALAWYHQSLALLSAFVYGYPSEKMTVIGVTGTNGKTTTVYLIAKALEAGAGQPSPDGLRHGAVGATSTAIFKVADKEWLNDKKMTMLGRFQLQKLLKQMVDAGCKYAVIEVSSEGIKQYRHLGINFDYAVFTNLTPEHIESHGGFENYKKAKGKLFEHLMKGKKKLIEIGGNSLVGRTINLANQITRQLVNKTTVINADDEHAEYFLSFPADKKITFGIENQNADYVAREVAVSLAGTSFLLACGQNSVLPIQMKLIGAFNVYNALPAIAIARNEGIAIEKIKSALENVKTMPGRMEVINEGQPFTIIVDYAPEPASMGKLYETVNQLRSKPVDSESKQTATTYSLQPTTSKIIHVLGSCGGGRDKARRPILGKMAGENADIVIVTNEDPYDDDPMHIINEVAAGAIDAGKVIDKNLFKILDRKDAIHRALSLAQAGDLVLVTGKGAEQAMAVADGRLIPWDDREVAREWLKMNV
ncbi:MAG: UDP-N-acetylmuramoyl-L-alanyl-D-glutamate--2,6-diaminopimelate ligase [Parcubacteria group bacterium]